ncbi:MAG: DUF3025 domain-containing protein [Ideonella sp.]
MQQPLVDGAADIDWSAPWFAPYRPAGLRVVTALAAGASVAQALNAELSALHDPPRLAAGPLRFVAQAELPARRPYETFIAETACVPTRDNLHDLFNGLAWLRWPLLKRHLNQLQAAEIAVQRVGTGRGAVRDALTLFDENAALLQLPPILEQALRERDWHALFVTHRASWAEARIWLFGHALLEKLVKPRKAITAHAWLVPADLAADQLQPWLAEHLNVLRLASRAHHPLPVLGVPGWWSANRSPAFYADAEVFRTGTKPWQRR